MTTRLSNRRTTRGHYGFSDTAGGSGGILASLDNIDSIPQTQVVRRKKKQSGAAESDWSDVGGETSPEKKGTKTKNPSFHRRLLPPPTKQSLEKEELLPSCVIVFPTDEKQAFPKLKFKCKGQNSSEVKQDDEMSALSFWSTDADASEKLNPRRNSARMRKKRQINIQSRQQHVMNQSPREYEGKSTRLLTKLEPDKAMLLPKIFISKDSQFLTIDDKSKKSETYPEEEENDSSTTSSTPTKTPNEDDQERDHVRVFEASDITNVNTRDVGKSDNNIVSDDDSCEEAEASFQDLDGSDYDEINGEYHYSQDEDYLPEYDDDTDSSDDELEFFAKEERVVRNKDHQQQQNTIVCHSMEKTPRDSCRRYPTESFSCSENDYEVEEACTDADCCEQFHTMTDEDDSAEEDDVTIEASIIEGAEDDDETIEASIIEGDTEDSAIHMKRVVKSEDEVAQEGEQIESSNAAATREIKNKLLEEKYESRNMIDSSTKKEDILLQKSYVKKRTSNSKGNATGKADSHRDNKSQRSHTSISNRNTVIEKTGVAPDDIHVSNHCKKEKNFINAKKGRARMKTNTAYNRKIQSNQHGRSIKAGRWKLGKKIGKGSFGVVHIGMNTESGTLMAVKSVQMNQVMMKDIRREIELLKSLEHINIVQYHGAEVKKMVLHIFQEWVPGGSITGMLEKFGSFSMPVIQSYLQQILTGLAYLHDNKIIHRDIKGSNVLVNDEGIVKLADFGASRKIANCQGEMLLTMTLRGTPYFMAPEVFEEKYCFKADIWSVGCVSFQMLTGKAPWKELGFNNPVSLFNHIKKHNGIPSTESWAGRKAFETKGTECALFKALLSKCFNPDPRLRPTTTDLLNDSFFIEFGDFSEDEKTAVRNKFYSPCNNSVYSLENLTSPIISKPMNNIIAGKTTTPNRSLLRSGSVAQISSNPPLFSPPVPKRSEESMLSSNLQECFSLSSSPLCQSSPEIDTRGWPAWARDRQQQRARSNSEESRSLAKGALMGSRLDDNDEDLRNQSCSLAIGVLMESLDVTGEHSEDRRAIVLTTADSNNRKNNPFSSSQCFDSSPESHHCH